MENKGINQSTNNRATFLQLMRYVSVCLVTIVLTIMLIMCIGLHGFDLGMALFFVIIFFAYMFYITLPIIGFWIYSFIKSISHHTKIDRILLYFHIIDLIMLGGVIYLGISKGEPDCNADIMAEHYEIYDREMYDLVNSTRKILPDSSRLIIEFDNGSLEETELLNDEQKHNLQKSLSNIGCIGIEIEKCGKRNYSTLRFRRVGMGMYSFLLYDHPLTPQQQDSINANECLIVFNDSTVFEFGGGAFGPQNFIGKKEFIEKHNTRTNESDS
ncbi:MAG: hypothetical protein K2J78_12505 [Muribaculaceae bacterium]|nr:hypothetical protein [Muribaculaceae bacterium]